MNDAPAERAAESTWTSLRRRKVVQWGVVYVAAAWGFLQGLEYLSGTYDWPRQIQQLTTLALLISLPIVLVLAWYHGDRGQQRISTSEFAILTLFTRRLPIALPAFPPLDIRGLLRPTRGNAR